MFSETNGVKDSEFIIRGDGAAFADKSWNGGGADFAELFENKYEEVILPGTIVALEDGKVRKAENDDAFILGVVSSQPGFIGNMGEIEENNDLDKLRWTTVALVGQVPVKIRGSIEHGDWIEMDYDGCGKATQSWHPDVIGRAMETVMAENETVIGTVKALIK